jgi:hypothetical protein
MVNNRHRLRAALTVACLLTATLAFAQTRDVSLLYGISAGGGKRLVSGTLELGARPAGVVPPEPDDRAIGTLALTVGARYRDRVALLAFWDQNFSGSEDDGHWGTGDIHASARVWLTRCLWAEAGGGASMLGYKPPTQISTTITRDWSPGFNAAVGLDVIETPRVAIGIFGRYMRATFHGQAIQHVSLQVELMGRK